MNTILTDDEAYALGQAQHMTSLKVRAIEAAVLAKLRQQEPVAMRYDFDGYGYRYIDNGSGSDWQTRIKDAEPLYAAPQPAVVQVPQGWRFVRRPDGIGIFAPQPKPGESPRTSDTVPASSRDLYDLLGKLADQQAAVPESPAQAPRLTTTDEQMDAMFVQRFVTEAPAQGDHEPQNEPHVSLASVEAQPIPAPWREAVKVAREALLDVKHGLEGAKIWAGMQWHYNPLHPFKYLPLRDKASAALAQLDSLGGGK
jgi:hypothetical protein